MIKNRHFPGAIFLLGAVLGSCGSTPENTNFPPEISKVPVNTSNDNYTRWALLLKELKVDIGASVKSDDDLKKILSKPSGFFSASSATAYTELLGSVVTDFAKDYASSKCGAVGSLTEIGQARKWNATAGKLEDISSAKVYLMKYQNLKDTSASETNYRSGLVVLPELTSTNGAKTPLVTFAHGGDVGLSYSDLAFLFGDLQSSHIILAPSYPGEAICKSGLSYVTRNCDESGKWAEGFPTSKSPYDGDAHDLLTMQNCLVRASLPSATLGLSLPVVDADGKAVLSNGVQVSLASRVQSLAKRIGGNVTSLSSLPVSYMMGVSRGGLTASVALAKNGAYLKAKLQDTATAVSGKIPSLYSCNIDVFGPKTFLATDFRVGFESFVRGFGESTRFIQLPTAVQMFARWKAYGDGKPIVGTTKLTDAQNAKLAAVEVAKFDMPLLSPLILGSVQNWGRYNGTAAASNKGAMLTVHGIYDAVVPVAQSLFGSTVFSGVNAAFVANSTDGVPGVTYDALGVVPPSKYLELTSMKGEYALRRKGPNAATQHGDKAFAESTVMASLVVCNSTDKSVNAACEEANKAIVAKYTNAGTGDTSVASIGRWLSTDCAAASSAN